MGQRLQQLQQAAQTYRTIADRFVLKDQAGTVIVSIDPEGPVIKISGGSYTEAETNAIVTFLEQALR